MDIKNKEIIKKAVETAAEKWFKENGISLEEKIEPFFELPNLSEHGDLSTNFAFKLAVLLKRNPKEIAKNITERINLPKDICEKISIAGAGFINFYFAKCSLYNILNDILKESGKYGVTGAGCGKKVLIEFVSANPTGPLTIAHARQAAVGDTLANIFQTAGYKVEKEYYLNDRGRQMNILAGSTLARYLELLGEPADFPEDGYKGDYIWDIARDAVKDVGKKYIGVPKEETQKFFFDYTKEKIMKMICKDLRDFGVRFDNWVSETELISEDAVEKALDIINKKGFIYQHEGAKWFKSTAFGDDKDRVLFKSSGEMTYLMPDIVYHENKYRRSFDFLINLWGPDHHGYIPRIKAAVEALGYSKDTLNVVIVQLTTLFRNGEPVSMSTRAGEFVSLRELLDEVGKDATRYYLAMRRPEAHLDFDLETAKKETPDNPVYYIQYAHARISSIFRKYKEHTGKDAKDINRDEADFSCLTEIEEIDIIKYLSQYPVMLEDCTRICSPHLVTDYLEGLVAKFHNYYEKHRVITSDIKITTARIGLIQAVKIVLKNGLDILGVSVPEEM